MPAAAGAVWTWVLAYASSCAWCLNTFDHLGRDGQQDAGGPFDRLVVAVFCLWVQGQQVKQAGGCAARHLFDPCVPHGVLNDADPADILIQNAFVGGAGKEQHIARLIDWQHRCAFDLHGADRLCAAAQLRWFGHLEQAAGFGVIEQRHLRARADRSGDGDGVWCRVIANAVYQPSFRNTQNGGDARQGIDRCTCRFLTPFNAAAPIPNAVARKARPL